MAGSNVFEYAMISENQTIVRCKSANQYQEAITLFVQTFCYSVGERNISQVVLLSLFSVFIFSMASNMIIVVQFIFFGPFSGLI